MNLQATQADITIISGAPATGKTTLAARLAAADDRIIHLRTDPFFTALPDMIDPAHPASKQQNENIVRQYCAVARSLADDGYQVLIDGVVGPWMLTIVGEQLRRFAYVVLHPPLETTVSQGAARQEQPVPEAVIRKMHAAFERYRSGYEQHFIDPGEDIFNPRDWRRYVLVSGGDDL